MKQSSIVVIDLGGTKINIGLYRQGQIIHHKVQPFNANVSQAESISFLAESILAMAEPDSVAVAIGVPSIVDIEQGIVFDAVNISSWQRVPLKAALEALVKLPVYVNNDVNCFVKGEHGLHESQQVSDMVGLCLGTGLGAGIILQDKLYTGINCCAGELGSISYLKSTLDDYCSGKFFKDNYGECGSILAEKARQGEESAIHAFEQFGKHVAVAISHLLLIMDPQLIVLGGSVAKSFDLFIDSIWQQLNAFPYKNVIEKLTIAQSQHENSALLGAAELYLAQEQVNGSAN